MRALAAAGSTVFFISHDLDQLSALCDRVMWLEHGVIREIGSPEDILEQYQRFVSRPADAA